MNKNVSGWEASFMPLDIGLDFIFQKITLITIES